MLSSYSLLYTEQLKLVNCYAPTIYRSFHQLYPNLNQLYFHWNWEQSLWIASRMNLHKGFFWKEKLGSGTIYRQKVEKETEPVSKTGNGGTRAEVFDSRELTFMFSRNCSGRFYLSSHLCFNNAFASFALVRGFRC